MATVSSSLASVGMIETCMNGIYSLVGRWPFQPVDNDDFYRTAGALEPEPELLLQRRGEAGRIGIGCWRLDLSLKQRQRWSQGARSADTLGCKLEREVVEAGQSCLVNHGAADPVRQRRDELRHRLTAGGHIAGQEPTKSARRRRTLED